MRVARARPGASAAGSLIHLSVRRASARQRPPTSSRECALVIRAKRPRARVVDSPPFTAVVVATIAVNAVVLGLQTYEGVVDRWGDAARPASTRPASRVRRRARDPHRARTGRVRSQFFRNGWNVFDFVVVVAVFVPGIRQNSTLLRLLAPPARRPHRARAARPARAPARRLAERAAARVDRRRDGDDPVRLRDGRVDLVRRRAAGAVGEHRPRRCSRCS